MSLPLFKLSPSERKYLSEIADELDKECGPKRLGDFVRICKRSYVYRNRKIGIVLKAPSFIMTPNTPLRVRIPTIKINSDWVAQPIAVRSRAAEAVIALQYKLVNVNPYPDLHKDNVGWIKVEGKLVPRLFDW